MWQGEGIPIVNGSFGVKGGQVGRYHLGRDMVLIKVFQESENIMD